MIEYPLLQSAVGDDGSDRGFEDVGEAFESCAADLLEAAPLCENDFEGLDVWMRPPVCQ